jgi:hypothetical protein
VIIEVLSVLKVTGWWDMILLSVVDGYEHFSETCGFHVQGRCREPVPLIYWSLFTKLHSTTTQKTVILKPK